MIVKIIRIISSKFIFCFSVTLVILALNVTPLISHIRHAPKDRQFSYVHNNIQDFYFYQALMNRGASGDFLTRDPFTTQPHSPSIIFSYFVLLGKLSKLLGIPFFISYHALRFAAGAVMFLLTYKLIKNLGVPHPRLVFLFFVFAAPLLRTEGPYMNWWTGMDPIRRAAYLPHHMVGGVLLLTTIILLIKYMHTSNSRPKADQPLAENIKLLIAVCFIVPLMAFIHTPSLFILLLIFPPAVIIYLLRNNSIHNLKSKKLIEYLGYCLPRRHDTTTQGRRPWEWGVFYWGVIGLFSLLMMVSQTNRGFPWIQYIIWEKTLQFPLGSELPGALGILFPFALMGTVVSISSRRFERILVASWFLIPILFIPLAPRLGISNIRLIQGVPYLPLSILSIYGIESMLLIFQIALRKVKIKLKNEKIIGLLGYWVIGLLFLRFTIPTLVWSVKDQIREYWTLYSNVYLDKRLFDAFSFINMTYPKDTFTLSTFYTGNYLPVYTDTRSFIGHTGYTPDLPQKELLVKKFFSGEMAPDEAKKLLMDNKITLVFQGPDEKPMYNKLLYPSILVPVYNHEAVTIYTMK